MAALDAAAFGEPFRVNATEYRVLEETKVCCHQPEGEGNDAPTPTEHRFELRRVVLWNLRTDQHTAVLCFDAGLAHEAQVIATAMRSRWGASQNTFKHLKERHPDDYHPGFGLAESE